MGRSFWRNHREAIRSTLRSLLTSAVLVTLYYLLPLDKAFTPTTVVALVGGIAAVALLLAWQIREITRAARPELRAMEALATSAPLYMLLFATVYYVMERSAPGSFSETLTRTDALYFTVTVFSTVGFGDITARSETARALVTGQMAVNVLLIGVAARLLVSAVQQGRQQQGAVEPGARGDGLPFEK
ncbi:MULTISPECIES: potassium channel family protein [unclassified Streptomyces]|uniref:potassium channel family protein n=1 Tax=unclassified Streptomyces TaxID=2593676 RepID=UPI0030D5AC6C